MKKLQMVQGNVPEGVIGLGVGQPWADLIPLDKVDLAWKHQLKKGKIEK